MKISELKQPYRRMAEYCKQNTAAVKLSAAFTWVKTNHDFWEAIDNGEHPPITEEIKQYFPPDFDFSGEDEYPNNQCDEACYYHCTEGGKIKPKCINENYTQLAQQGKFDELPDTCEFSEPVELEAGGDEFNKDFRKITGKYKGCYMDILYIGWQYAQLPTPKIDFSEFKSGDILEITNKDNEKYYGLLYLQTINELVITLSYNSKSSRHILKENIKSITKIK